MVTISLIAFITKSSLSIFFVWLIWFTLLRKVNRFGAVRYFLMLGILFSVLLPFIVPAIISLFPSSFSSISLPILYLIPEVTVTQNQSASFYSWNEILSAIYLLAVLFLLTRFVVQISKIGILKFTGKKTYKHGVYVIEHSKTLPPFSFFGNCFLNPNEVPAEKIDIIIHHESVHIKHHHSADIIILELIGLFQWFNPFYWLLKRAVVEIHEFQADQIVLTSKSDQHAYMDSIVSLAFCGIALSLGNNFNKSLTLKRLAMMNSKKHRRYFVPVLLLSFALAFGFVFFISCNKTESIDENEVVVIKSQEKIDINKSDVNETVYTVVEEMPVFENDKSQSMVKFREFIAKNLKYPDIAAKNSIQGRVYVSFVVDSEGNVKDAKVERGVDSSLDEEALRVINSSPKWAPGKQRGKNVAVQFTFPIVFKLQ